MKHTIRHNSTFVKQQDTVATCDYDGTPFEVCTRTYLDRIYPGGLIVVAIRIYGVHCLAAASTYNDVMTRQNVLDATTARVLFMTKKLIDDRKTLVATRSAEPESHSMGHGTLKESGQV